MKTIEEMIDKKLGGLYPILDMMDDLFGETLGKTAKERFNLLVKSLITTIIKEAMPYPVIEDELMEWDEGFNQYRRQLINNLKERGIEV